LDDYIRTNVVVITEDGIKKYISGLKDFSLVYDGCYIKYNKEKNYFLIQYYSEGNFSKEEFYEYIVKGNSIIYGCVDYSYKKGVLK
jgi:hypothetical protein